MVIRGPTPSDDLLRRLTEEAASRTRIEDVPEASAPRPLAARMPLAAQLATGGHDRVFNGKIWQDKVGDFKRGKPFRAGAFFRRVRAKLASNPPPVGWVSHATILQACGELHRADHDNDGKVQIGFVFLGYGAGRCKETMRKAIRWLRDQDLVDVMNALDRLVSGHLYRNANVYVLRDDDGSEQQAETGGPAPPAELSEMARLNATLARWADAFGLTPRPWGLNATPLRGAPAPA